MPVQQVTVDVFLSVDGWAGSDNLPGYFGYFGPDLEEWVAAELALPQLILLGRRTYEALSGMPADARDESSRRMFATEKIVFSRTLDDVDWPNTRICRDDAVSHVEQLRNSGDLPLRTMGSLSIGRQLLDAGLVDRLRLMIFPLLAGPEGREPFFAGVHSADLELVDHRVLDNRILLTEYAPPAGTFRAPDHPAVAAASFGAGHCSLSVDQCEQSWRLRRSVTRITLSSPDRPAGVEKEARGDHHHDYGSAGFTRRSGNRQRGGRVSGPPQGILFHVATEAPGGVRVTDVWESRDAFERFRDSLLMPAMGKYMAEHNMSMDDAPQPHLEEAFDLIVGSGMRA